MEPHAVALAKVVHAYSESIDCANDLMTGDYRKFGKRQIPFHDVQVRMTNAAGSHAHSDFARGRIRSWKLGEPAEGTPRPAALFLEAWSAWLIPSLSKTVRSRKRAAGPLLASLLYFAK